jgi:putative endonuclease
MRFPFRAPIARLLAYVGLGAVETLGARGEGIAAEFLESQGYCVRSRNFRVRGGEADIIAAKDGLVVVVEVKTRSTGRFGSPAQAVNDRKSRRVVRAGRTFCRRQGLSLARLRFDVVAVEWPHGGGEPRIRHYPGALSGRGTM